MCWCTPEIRTPFCGKEICRPPPPAPMKPKAPPIVFDARMQTQYAEVRCSKCGERELHPASITALEYGEREDKFRSSHVCQGPPPYVYDPACPCSACRAEGLKR